jgi:hypothetical protein
MFANRSIWICRGSLFQSIRLGLQKPIRLRQNKACYAAASSRTFGNAAVKSGERLSGGIKYFDYGVLSVVLHSPFVGHWQDLLLLASRWVWDIDFAARSTELVRRRLERVTPAFVKPYASWLSEDYLIFQIQRASDCESVAGLIDRHNLHIAEVVRGDTGPLAESEINEVMRSRVCYYATGLAIIGLNAAFIYNSASDAETAVHLLEYANSQLLAFCP